MINLTMFGAGRIGYVHALAISLIPNGRIKNIFDINAQAARKIADISGATVCSDIREAIEDDAVDGYIIASPTDTHCRLILEGVERKKAVFCEKPIGMNLTESKACVVAVKQQKGLCSMGFNRRYDPSFFELKTRIQKGEIGNVESVIITTRDPDLAPIDYLKTSGGLFKDMMIHDFDMVRYILNEEPDSIYSAGSCLINSELKTFGDIDTASVVIKTPSGKICTINNSRRSGFGYDQRIEVLGSSGLLSIGNRTPTAVQIANDKGVTSGQPEYFFLERYKDAYRLEIENFIDCISGNAMPLANETDGLNALIMAEAAGESLKTGQAVPLNLT